MLWQRGITAQSVTRLIAAIVVVDGQILGEQRWIDNAWWGVKRSKHVQQGGV